MTVMAIPPAQQRPSPTRKHHAALPAVPHAVAEARRQVRAAIRYWRVPVDMEVAALLVSELVTNAITHDGISRPRGGDAEVTLTIRCGEGHLRVEVYDTSPTSPVPSDGVPHDAEHGRGLLLVGSMATTWGSFPAAAGKAVYFTLAFDDEARGEDDEPHKPANTEDS